MFQSTPIGVAGQGEENRLRQPPQPRTRRRVPVAVAVIVENGQVLIAHRFPDAHLPDLWEFPGGKLDPGEEPAACAVREASEELGIEVEILGLLFRRPYDYADRRVDLWFYAARRVSGEPRAIGCTEWRWVRPESLADYPLPDASEPVVAALREGGWLPGLEMASRERVAAVLSTRRLSPNVCEIVLRPDDSQPESFRPGQYWVLSPSDHERAPFSIATPPSRSEEIGFCINTATVDGVARSIARLRPGDPLRYTGPHGGFTLREDSPLDPIFVGMGTGIAPLRSMILELIARRAARRMDLIFGARALEDVLYRDDFERLTSRHANFRYHPCLTRPPAGWTGHVGRVTDRLPEILSDVRGREAYLCGSLEMVGGSIERLVSMGIDRSLCFREEWG